VLTKKENIMVIKNLKKKETKGKEILERNLITKINMTNIPPT
jgi:hypothetical protein